MLKPHGGRRGEGSGGREDVSGEEFLERGSVRSGAQPHGDIAARVRVSLPTGSHRRGTELRGPRGAVRPLRPSRLAIFIPII